jgi:DNA-binding CsgD family transcriptional regulator
LSRVIELSDDLLDLIYDAATDEALWKPALVEIAHMTDSVGGYMFGADNKARLVTFAFKAGLSEEADQAYRERHVYNVHAEVMNNRPVGKLVRSDDIMPLAALQRTAFYNEVHRVQDVAHTAMVSLAAKDNFQAGFTLCRSKGQGPYGAEELQFVSQLYPHLRRALLLSFRLDAYKTLQRAQSDVLDQLSDGMMLLDHSARVVFANAAARVMTDHGGPLRLRNSVLTAVSPAQSQQLRGLVDAAIRGMPAATMALPHPRDGRLFTVLVSSVRSRDIARFSGLGFRNAATMLVIHDPARRMEVPVEWIMDAYAMTMAEARVALCTASGATIPETASRLSVSPNTVKTHLRKVYAKTGVGRQAELARLIASLDLLRTQASSGSEES